MKIETITELIRVVLIAITCIYIGFSIIKTIENL